MNIIFSSCGNDSVATIQWAFEQGLSDIVVAYSDTQWAAPEWQERVDTVSKWVFENGGAMVVIPSEGFPDLVRRKKAFPANGMGFCSYELKILPAKIWLDSIDPEKQAICYVGVMQIESENRKDWPRVKEDSPNHGGRTLVSPLAEMTVGDRDGLLERAGFDVLPHRSKECSPCINATIKDIQKVSQEDLIKVVNLEIEMGVGERSGKPKYMFRPHRMAGAKGFEQVKAWADQGGGSYSPDQEDLFGCSTAYCGI
jgi:3'-phosphoadenosine 5'-phosphosulfate sulfotransferase (PAPS reductase)/FAD synthetase